MLRYRRKTAALLVAMGLAMSLLVACSDSSNEDNAATETSGDTRAGLRVAFVPATTALPLHVAKVQGIFDRNNLDVTLTQANNISDIPATLGRQYDLTIGTATDLIRAGGAGVDVVQATGNTVDTEDNPFVQLMVRPDSGITDVSQLAGKTVGSPTLSGVIHVAVLNWAKEKGVDPATIKGVEAPSPNLPDQLKAGNIDAVEALEPFASQLRAAGNVSLGDPFASIASPLSTNFFMAQGSWAKKNRPAIARFVDSLEQAKAFIDQNPVEARRILQGYTNMPQAVADKVPLPTFDFSIRKQDLSTWVDVLKGVGQFEGKVDVNELVLSPSS